MVPIRSSLRAWKDIPGHNDRPNIYHFAWTFKQYARQLTNVQLLSGAQWLLLFILSYAYLYTIYTNISLVSTPENGVADTTYCVYLQVYISFNWLLWVLTVCFLFLLQGMKDRDPQWNRFNVRHCHVIQWFKYMHVMFIWCTLILIELLTSLWWCSHNNWLASYPGVNYCMAGREPGTNITVRTWAN